MDIITVLLIVLSIILFIIGSSFQTSIIKSPELRNVVTKLQDVYTSIIDLDIMIFLISLFMSVIYTIYFFLRWMMSKGITCVVKEMSGETNFIARIMLMLLFLLTGILLAVHSWYTAYMAIQFALIMTIVLLNVFDRRTLQK